MALKEENKVFFISDRKKTAELVQSKILLLRAVDEFVHIPYRGAFDEVKEECPCVIFYDLKDHEKEFFNFMNKVKQTPSLENSSVILLFNEMNEETLCSAFESGISDFLPLNATDSEFTVRVLWAIGKKEHALDFSSKSDILCRLNILEKESGIYTKNYTYTILKEENSRNNGSLAVIAPDVNTRNKISPELLASIVKRNIRITDILGFSGDFKLYAWFPKTNADRILSILDKIKKQLPPDCTISAGIAHSSSNDFDKTEEHANKALSEALLRENSSVIYTGRKKEEIKKPITSYKNFKLFKQTFHKKFENIISPLFYQTQKIIEEKLFETTVKQEIKESESWFNLSNNTCESLFKITYPGYTKINIDITHDINSKIYADRVSMDLAEICTDKISPLLDKFIKDHQAFASQQ